GGGGGKNGEWAARQGGGGGGGGERVVNKGAARAQEGGVAPGSLGADKAAPPAGREELDELGVARRDHKDCHRHEQRQSYGEKCMPAQRQERFFRAVARGGEAVGTQPDPRQESDQGDTVEHVRRQRVFRPAKTQGA